MAKVRNLEVEYLPIESLIGYARNSRTHSKDQIAQIVASISEFGFTSPILIAEDNTIIAGHGRIAAATSLKMESVPTIRLSGLTETQRRALVIIDNKLALNAGWDDELLGFTITTRPFLLHALARYRFARVSSLALAENLAKRIKTFWCS